METKIKIQLYKHKIPAIVLAGFPTQNGNTGKYLYPTNPSVFLPLTKLFVVLGLDVDNSTHRSAREELFQAFCNRFVGRELSQQIWKDATGLKYDLQFFASEFGAIFENPYEGSTIALQPFDGTGGVRATNFLNANRIMPKDLSAFFAPIGERHARFLDEFNEYKAGKIVGKGEAVQRAYSDSANGATSATTRNTEKFNGISPTTSRANSLVETSSTGEDEKNTSGTETTTRDTVDGLEKARELEAVAGVRNPVAVIMDEIALLFDDDFSTPIKQASRVLIYEGEAGGHL